MWQQARAWQPLVFFSQHFRKPERKYSAFDRELLAIYLSIRHFRYYLEARAFTIFTDHEPLTSAMAKTSDPWSNRHQSQLSYISEFSTDIRHVSGNENLVADALSRIQINTLLLGVDYKVMATCQQQDTEIEELRNSKKTSYKTS